jgi:hypothetical protein
MIMGVSAITAAAVCLSFTLALYFCFFDRSGGGKGL